MSTWCIVPIYYYNDIFLQKDYVSGIYSNNYGFKYFMYGTMANGSDSFKLNLPASRTSSTPPLTALLTEPVLRSTASAGCICTTARGIPFPTLLRATPSPTTV
jgi:peptide/nickel transport system substrate-binding protein/oligopeptide transport system substrate-binding protein